IGAGVFGEIPDNLPVVGNLDEVFFSGLLIVCLAKLGINIVPNLQGVRPAPPKRREGAKYAAASAAVPGPGPGARLAPILRNRAPVALQAIRSAPLTRGHSLALAKNVGGAGANQPIELDVLRPRTMFLQLLAFQGDEVIAWPIRAPAVVKMSRVPPIPVPRLPEGWLVRSFTARSDRSSAGSAVPFPRKSSPPKCSQK